MKQFFDMLSQNFLTWSVEYNDHEAVYQTIEEVNKNRDDFEDWISLQKMDEAIMNNSRYSLRIYPSTPVGFYQFLSSDLESLIEHVEGLIDNDLLDQRQQHEEI